MTPSELRYLYEQENRGHFFDRSTMKFLGDTMKNFGVRKVRAVWRYPEVHGGDREPFDAWELYRKKPVKHGLQDSHYFGMNGRHLPGAVREEG